MPGRVSLDEVLSRRVQLRMPKFGRVTADLKQTGPEYLSECLL